MTNSNRNFVKILYEICKKHNISIRSFGQDWVFELNKGNKYHYVIGYEFPDTSSSKRICDDKSALSEVLSSHHIDNVPHIYFMNPKDLFYIGETDWKKRLIKTFKKFNNDVVIKPNSGTGGVNVYRVNKLTALRKKINYIFKNNMHVSIAPFFDVKHEYRVIVYQNKIQLIFDKQRTSSWKHNLAHGSRPILLKDSILKSKIAKLAIRATSLLNIRFASVDIVEVDSKLMILEINAGVMLERFSSTSKSNYLIAKKIYEQVISDL